MTPLVVEWRHLAVDGETGECYCPYVYLRNEIERNGHSHCRFS